jgi:mono/diheme cytochrome c family protein
MLLIIFGVAAAIVGLLGFRGQTSTNRPWHIFLDMKYQPKYTAQGQSPFFADGRSSREPLPGTIPYTGGVYRTDAGDLAEPNPDYIPDADLPYFRGRTKPDEMGKVTIMVEKEVDGTDKDGKPIKVRMTVPEERDQIVNFFVEKIPKKTVERAAYADGERAYHGFEALMRRGRERFTIHCAVCHGDTGLGGQGETAHGVVGRDSIDPATGRKTPRMIGIASYHIDRLREAPDGYLFDVITNGKNTMSAYGHQVPPQDRWAIVAYIRALQLSQNAPERLVDAGLRQRLMGGPK